MELSRRKLNNEVSRSTQFHAKVASELWLNIHGRDYRLIGKEIRIGRSADNDIIIEHKSISRYHAQISIRGQQIILEDLKSRNGTKVNRQKIDRVTIKDNDQIQMGDLLGVFFLREKDHSPVGFGGFTTLQSSLQKVQAYLQGSGIHLNPGEMKDKFQKLDAKKKIIFVSAFVLAAFVGLSLFSGKKSANLSMVTASLDPTAVMEPVTANRDAVEKCVELEDLGNFRQAIACFKQLPPSADVQASLSRVQERQVELAEQRYVEATNAYNNYYYDIAIQKYQEVVLIADENSDVFAKAKTFMEQAERRRHSR